jgi:hypothetical protein
LTGAINYYCLDPSAVTFDKDDHMVLALVNSKTRSFALRAGRVMYADGGLFSPMLFFNRF